MNPEILNKKLSLQLDIKYHEECIEKLKSKAAISKHIKAIIEDEELISQLVLS